MNNNSEKFRSKLQQGQICLGAGISFSDPTVTEALCGMVDFVWIDMEHNPLSLESVQGHIMATKGSDTTPLVRVPWNDPVLIKPVLDIGAAGVIIPFIRTAEDVRGAVAACRYPPEGIRGFGPRRPSNYARLGGPEFCRIANENMITIVQIEHRDAVENIDEILAVKGLTGIVFGPNDLASFMGHVGEPGHPEVIKAIEMVLVKAREANVYAGISIGSDVEILRQWIDKGMQWLTFGCDFTLMLQAAKEVIEQVRAPR